MYKSLCEIIVGALVIVFALWQTSFSKWILVILGVILIIHSFSCRKCFYYMEEKQEKRKRRR